jgi:hypothetical protein
MPVDTRPTRNEESDVTQIKIKIPGSGEHDGEAPIVILGPNGSGKTRLAQKIAQSNEVSAISAQRRIWIDDSLPVQEEKQLRNNVRSHIDRWRQDSWLPTEEINFILSTLIQDHTNLLTKKNEEAIDSGKPTDPVKDTKLILLQGLWNRLFPKRKLEIGGFFPKVKRLDASAEALPYQLRQMSDGERPVLYGRTRHDGRTSSDSGGRTGTSHAQQTICTVLGRSREVAPGLQIRVYNP